MIGFRRLFILLFIFSVSGCAGSSGRAFAGQEIDAAVIFNSVAGEGLGESPGASWISDEKGLLAVFDKINRQRIGGNETPVPAIDYDHEGVLLIRMGRKPTGGYGIALASDKAYIEDRTAVVTVRWIEPSKEAILTTIITSPCIMIKLPRDGYTRIKAVDQKGIVRAETTLEMPLK